MVRFRKSNATVRITTVFLIAGQGWESRDCFQKKRLFEKLLQRSSAFSKRNVPHGGGDLETFLEEQSFLEGTSPRQALLGRRCARTIEAFLGTARRFWKMLRGYRHVCRGSVVSRRNVGSSRNPATAGGTYLGPAAAEGFSSVCGGFVAGACSGGLRGWSGGGLYVELWRSWCAPDALARAGRRM